MEINSIYIERIDSTNNYIRNLLDQDGNVPNMTLVYTAEQTAGRGQRGNSWESEYGKNALFSIVCHPEDKIAPARQFILSQCISLAVQKVISGCLDDALFDDDEAPVRIKWPNDIYICDKKVCGILIECDLMGKSIRNGIIGIGININQKDFVSDAPNPISLKQIIGKDQDVESIIYEVAMQFGIYYDMAIKGNTESIVHQYMNALYRRDGFHWFEDANGKFQATISDVEPTGHLILTTIGGKNRRYEFKEVKYII